MKKFNIFLLFFLTASKLLASDIKLIGATISLQDKTTGKPISGVYIYRTAGSTYYKFSNYIVQKVSGIWVEGPEVRTHIVDYAVTNKKGIATFPQAKIKDKKFKEEIFQMIFYINVMIPSEYNSARMDGLVKTCFSGDKPENAKVISGDGTHDAVVIGVATYELTGWNSGHCEIINNKIPRHEYDFGRLEYISSRFVFDFNKKALPPITVKLGKSNLDGNIINTEVFLGDVKKEPSEKQAGTGDKN